MIISSFSLPVERILGHQGYEWPEPNEGSRYPKGTRLVSGSSDNRFLPDTDRVNLKKFSVPCHILLLHDHILW